MKTIVRLTFWVCTVGGAAMGAKPPSAGGGGGGGGSTCRLESNSCNSRKICCSGLICNANGICASSQPAPVPTPTAPFPNPPTQAPVDTVQPYYPGDLTVVVADKNGRTVTMSTGMMGRAIAYTGQRVAYTDGSSGQSSINFHIDPDAAGCFPSSSGGFYYSSNAEASAGGVGTIEFDANGQVKGYYRTLSGTNNNCGGGKTPWGTWISCEEVSGAGRVWQTDPSGVIPARRTEVVARGGNYESFAFDDRTVVPTFYTTEDSATGPLVRFTPDAAAMACYNAPTAADKWCTLESGTYAYLWVSGGSSGTFEWKPTEVMANPSQYPNSEGIDVVDGILYFVSKVDKTLFMLDLDAGTYVRTSTVSGAFNLQPDQLKAIVDDPNDIVYFCEDGGSACDLHGRDNNGDFFTVLVGTGYSTETTGLAFCQGAKYMMLSFQAPGVIWQFWREDGLPFSGQIIDIKYHKESSARLRLLRTGPNTIMT